MPNVQARLLQGPGSSQSCAVMHATHRPVASHFPAEHSVPTRCTPGTHALLRHVEVAHSPPLGMHSFVVMVWPSALHVSKLLPTQAFELGTHTLQALRVALQPASQASSFAKAEPSSLHVFNVVPSELQVTEPGTHCISRQAPASSLHSSAEAHSLTNSYRPSCVHWFSAAPSH